MATMDDLQARAGIAVDLRDLRLHFDEPMTQARLSVRTIGDLAAVWRDPLDPMQADVEIYAVYWGAVRAADAGLFQAEGLDHAYVIIKPGVCGLEYYKTQGHYHPPINGTALGEPELYHVLAGRGLFLLQCALPSDWTVKDVIAIGVEPGSVVIVPPNYGHLTVNWSREPLVFEAFLSPAVAPSTLSYRERRGGACYCLATPEGPRVVPNEQYGAFPPARRDAPWQWPADARLPFYSAIVGHLPRFTWLRFPERFDLERVAADLRQIATI
jgi:glucose-6-phosphate isomerase